VPRSSKKIVKTFPESVFQSHLGEAFKVNDSAVACGLEGIHSHKKVGFKTGNACTELALTDGSLTTKDRPAERRRTNLEPGMLGDFARQRAQEVCVCLGRGGRRRGFIRN